MGFLDSAAQQAQQEKPEEDAYTAWMNEARTKLEDLFTNPNINMDDADTRFSSALPLRRVRDKSIVIIGAGGLGNWQWRVLLGMGFRTLAIYDDDVVSLENIGPQAHSLMNFDRPKVEAIRDEALLYRGVEIIARNKRVATYSDIVDDLGFAPDIVIGCTDSTEFRNGFIGNMKDTMIEKYYISPKAIHSFPELFLDFRMTLGDWTVFVTPYRALLRINDYIYMRLCMSQYKEQAVFPHEQAIQEPCTERAIVYTGMSVASYTGAFLHWYLTEGKATLSDIEGLKKFYANTGTPFSWMHIYSSRDWETITPTKKELRLRDRLNAEKAKLQLIYEALFTQLQRRIVINLNMLDADEEYIPGDIIVSVWKDKPLKPEYYIVSSLADNSIETIRLRDDGSLHVDRHGPKLTGKQPFHEILMHLRPIDFISESERICYELISGKRKSATTQDGRTYGPVCYEETGASLFNCSDPQTTTLITLPFSYIGQFVEDQQEDQQEAASPENDEQTPLEFVQELLAQQEQGGASCPDATSAM